LIIGHTGNTEPASPRERLQSSSDVDPIPKQITGADHDVADMHAYAEVDLTGLRNGFIGFGQGILSLHGTSDRINGATELRQHTVARRVSDAASMARDQSVQDFPARRERIQGRYLIGSHEAAIALHVSREDSSQPALRFNGLGQG
jgi:hypothetical protein